MTAASRPLSFIFLMAGGVWWNTAISALPGKAFKIFPAEESRLIAVDWGVLISMKMKRTLLAKIVQHGEGMGVPTADTVRQRAMEIARIDGRNQANQQDWQQAKQELQGGHFAPDDDSEGEMMESVSEHDMVAGSLGHHTETCELEDAQNVVEELIAEGMDEAVH